MIIDYKQGRKGMRFLEQEQYIRDFPQDPEVEAKIIVCFKGEDHTLLFPWVKPNVEDLKKYPDMSQEFILGKFLKLKYITEEIIDEENSPNDIYWYELQGQKAIQQVIEYEGLTYTFYVLNKGDNFQHLSYQLKVYEHHEIQGEEHRSLFILTKDGHINPDIVGRLRQAINELE